MWKTVGTIEKAPGAILRAFRAPSFSPKTSSEISKPYKDGVFFDDSGTIFHIAIIVGRFSKLPLELYVVSMKLFRKCVTI